jgi:aryl-alcohol dehydrogenase-like predicted oxidoreductase
MRNSTLGSSGVQVSEICLGGNTFGSPCDQATTSRIVGKALDLGVNFIDTADRYANGTSEEFIGNALKGRRDDVVIATKTGARYEPGWESGGRLTRRRITAKLEASLRRLQTDRIDVYYCHFPDPLTPIEETLRVLDDLVRAGKILYPACSNFAGWELADIAHICAAGRCAPMVAAQHRYNLINRVIEAEVIPAAEKFGMAIIAYSPLAAGFLTGKYRSNEPLPPGSRFAGSADYRNTLLTAANFQALERYECYAAERGATIAELALGWLLAQPAVCSAIVGATSEIQVEQNIKAAQFTLSYEESRQLT